MEELIRFRSRMDLINDDEFIMFIKSYSKDFVANVLFQHFHNQLIHTNNIQEWENKIRPNVDKMSDTINNIIDSRNKNNQKNKDDQEIDIDERKEQTINLKLDNLPFIMISYISSFLNIDDTLIAERTNGSLFIGSRSPISIQKMNKNQLTKCIKYSNLHQCMYNFYRFQSIKELVIDVQQIIDEYYYYEDSEYKHRMDYTFIKPNLSNLPIWTNLKTLKMEGDESPNFEIGFVTNFDKQNLSKITTFTYNGGPFYDLSEFTKDIFPNLEFLELDTAQMSWNQLDDADILDEIDIMFDLSALRGLSIIPHDNDNYQPIMRRVCHSLESFHTTMSDGCIVLCPENKLAQLKEICIRFKHDLCYGEDQDALEDEDLLNGLERINLDISRVENITNQMVDPTFIHFLLSGRSLNYLSIKCSKYQQLRIILEILRNVVNSGRKTLIKVRISCLNYSDQKNGADINNEILNLTNCLLKMSDHFMLICDIPSINLAVNEFNNKCLIEYDGNNKCIVSNKGCTINGYHEQWIMNCDCCNQWCHSFI